MRLVAPNALALVALASLAACSSTKSSTSGGAACAANAKVGDVCTGATSAALCDADVCTEDASCTTVAKVASDGELQAALGGAQSGSCVALAPGSYASAALPVGVSLLGKGPASVKIGGVTVNGGGGSATSLVRGLAIGNAGFTAAAGAHAKLADVTIATTDKDGVSVGAGASVDLSATEIAGTKRYGVYVSDGAVTFENVWIHGAQAPGVWAECTQGCGCANVTMKDVLLDGNFIAGVALVGTTANVDDVEIRNNGVASDFTGGAGMSVAACSSLTATRLSVHDNTSYGLLVDASSAKLGGPDKSAGVDVSRNLMGVWIQNLAGDGSTPVSMENATLTSNQAVGMGLSGGSIGVTIKTSGISGTTSKVIPTFSKGVAASQEVGDGLVWLDASEAAISDLTLSSNARASLLINGSVAAGSRIDTLVQSGGDEQKGILQQNFPTDGVSPLFGPTLPAPQKIADERFAVPAAPRLPAPQK